MKKPNVNTFNKTKRFVILVTSINQNSTMEKKNTLWVVVTWDNESARLTSKESVKTEYDAKNEVKKWYYTTLDEYNNDDEGYYAAGALDDDCLFAIIDNYGRYESCEAFEVEI